MQELPSGDAWKKILGPAREPHDLVRKHRPGDEHQVVIENAPVDLDRQLFAQQPVGEAFDDGGRRPI
jgi:hypothetical protein